MKKLLTMAVMGSVLLVSGCATQTGLIQPTQNTTPEYTKSQTFFIGGIGQEQTVNGTRSQGHRTRFGHFWYLYPSYG